MADAELIEKVETALYDLDRADAEIVENEVFLRFAQANAVTHFRNGVLRSVFTPDEADARIEETIAHFDGLGLPFRWLVTPSTRPADMAERLLAHGFTHFETLHAMVARPDAFPPAERDDVEVVDVDASNLDDWVEVCENAWGLVPAAVERFREQALRGIEAEPQTEFYYVAWVDGVPAASAALEMIEDFAHFAGASTKHEYRNRGLYRELIYARMARLRDRGVAIATNHCVSTTSAPICAKLGFERVCDFEVYVHEPPASEAD